MIPQPFLIAVPIGWVGRDGVEAVERLSEVCGSGPRLWLGAATRSVTFEGDLRVIGPVFDQEGRLASEGHAIAAPPAGSAVEIATRLSREFWGAYLAILPGREDGKLRVLCDPSGLLPVYRAASSTHCLISSDPQLSMKARSVDPAIDWAALRDHLCWPEYRQAATCLAGMEELSPGVLYDLGHANVAVRIWRVSDHMPSSSASGFDEAAEALRRRAQLCIGAWANIAGRVAVAASGGVDSSLICGALASGNHAFGCITLATADPSGDERNFVEELATHLNVAMESGIYAPDTVDLTQAASIGLPRPARRTLSLAIDSALDEARIRLGANAVFDGNGGDNLFCFLHSAAPVVDRMTAEGLYAALPTFVDMCRVTGADVPTMLRAVWRRAWRRSPRDLWPAERDLLADLPDHVPLPPPLTPWLGPDRRVHGGKRDHLALLMHAQNHVHGLGKPGVPRFSPLMSQPLIELCLSLPTWLWYQGGINRSLARAAFADVLPRAVLRRTAKAGPDSFVRRLFAKNRIQIRAMLLEGHLARQGLTDRAAIEAAMGTDPLSKDPVVYRLLDLCEAEAWARSWIG